MVADLHIAVTVLLRLSIYHRSVEVGRHLLKTPGPNPLIKQSHLQPSSTMSRWLLNIPPRTETPHCLWATCVSAWEKVLLDVQRETPVFQCAPTTSGPVTGHH